MLPQNCVVMGKYKVLEFVGLKIRKVSIRGLIIDVYISGEYALVSKFEFLVFTSPQQNQDGKKILYESYTIRKRCMNMAFTKSFGGS